MKNVFKEFFDMKKMDLSEFSLKNIEWMLSVSLIINEKMYEEDINC